VKKIENIKEVLLELGYSNIMDTPKAYRARPIYRDSDNNTVLSIDKTSGHFIDFARNITGSFDDLVKLSLNLTTIEEARVWLSTKTVSVSIERVQKPEIQMSKIYSPSLLNKLHQDHSYWEQRGVSTYSVSEFKGGVSKSGKMQHRYVFPIFNGKNEVIGFAGRDLLQIENNKRPKWKLIGDKSMWKYPLFLNYKLLKSEKRVIIVESIGDMLSLWDAGIKNVVVSFGLSLSSGLVNTLLRYDISDIIVSFNDDSENNGAGNRAATKARNKLLNYFDPSQVRVIFPTLGDFGEMSKQQISDWMGKING
jgi:hypothetical protein